MSGHLPLHTPSHSHTHVGPWGAGTSSAGTCVRRSRCVLVSSLAFSGGTLTTVLDYLRPPIKCGTYFLPSHSLLMTGVSARQCVGGSLHLGLGAWVSASSLLVAAW
ncbi:hypothetical protein XENOCAPTIV_011359 [Xenoophorus captivus]|uniref:Uncharacterized protein n=1 Tax=Xenoophorus captivus TaxID=1517983 RepID=A0ABV0RY55_9TELE